jgi:hypothetical protein
VETNYDSKAFDVVLQLKTLLPPSPPTIKEIHKLNTSQFFWRMANSVTSSSWQQIAYLLAKPWFHRVWVIEEVLVA